MKSILATVKDDVIAFIESNSELFFNERDFQMHLAVYLRGLNKYDGSVSKSVSGRNSKKGPAKILTGPNKFVILGDKT